MNSMTANEAFLLDTNLLVYAHDTTDLEKHKTCMEIINNCLDEKATLVVSSQNLSEFFSVTTTKRILTKEDAISIINDIINFSNWIKIDFDHKTALEAAKLSEQYDMPYWDALLAATMKQNGILNIYTENAKDFKMPWINVVNPFEKLAKNKTR